MSWTQHECFHLWNFPSFLKAVFLPVPNHGLFTSTLFLDPHLTFYICSPQLCFQLQLGYLTQIMIACFIWWVYLGLYFKPLKSLGTQEDRSNAFSGWSKDYRILFYFFSFVIEGKRGNLNKYGIRIELYSLGKI